MLEVMPEGARFSLRLADTDAAEVVDVLGFALPMRVGDAAGAGHLTALCVGPDDWILHAPEADGTTIEAAFAGLDIPHSLVDIGHREIAVTVRGEQACAVLSYGCPLDLGRMRVGTGTRTLFEGVQVVITKEAPDSFRVEVWRSFFPHVWTLLQLASRELGAP